MASFTQTYMAAIMPESSGLDSIGSVAANFARTSEDEIAAENVRFSNHSHLAEMILASQGQVTYLEYISRSQAGRNVEQGKEATRLARRAARHAAFRRCRQHLKAWVFKSIDKASGH